MAELDIGVRDGALWLTLNRPQRFNAITDALADALAHEIEEAATQPEIRVIVLTGAGAAFCSGADVAADAARLDGSSVDRANRVVRAIVASAKPVVAAVNGIAAGVGCSFALAADLAVAAESASFLLVFTRVGLMPDGGSTATVAAAVGRARALRMALLAEPMSATEAAQAGLIGQVVPDADFDAAVSALVDRLVSGPPSPTPPPRPRSTRARSLSSRQRWIANESIKSDCWVRPTSRRG